MPSAAAWVGAGGSALGALGLPSGLLCAAIPLGAAVGNGIGFSYWSRVGDQVVLAEVAGGVLTSSGCCQLVVVAVWVGVVVAIRTVGAPARRSGRGHAARMHWDQLYATNAIGGL